MPEQKEKTGNNFIVCETKLRLISLIGWLDKECLAYFQKHLFSFQQKPGGITCVINSDCGGETSTSVAIHDLIKTSPRPVTTVGDGDLFSSGLCIFLGGKRRILLPHTYLIFHENLGNYDANDQHSANVAQNVYQKQNERLTNIINENSLMNEQSIRDAIRNSSIFSAEEAVRYGLAHEIIHTFPINFSKSKRKK